MNNNLKEEQSTELPNDYIYTYGGLSAEIPVPSAAVQTPWSAVFTSETVGLKCSMQGSPDPWIYTWYRGGQEVAVQGPGVSDGADGSQFVISSARLEHAGQYTCTGRLKDRPVKSAPSNTLTLEVKGESLLMIIMNTESSCSGYVLEQQHGQDG